ncbi:uncharacterized protein JCM6883_007604 [Sporobolomyces salmoneus]|uniref:uncharacterized protein n=1 Tax=Sporobolomyces salmoneus TaxID=183962 RepID=UPI00317D0564
MMMTQFDLSNVSTDRRRSSSSTASTSQSRRRTITQQSTRPPPASTKMKPKSKPKTKQALLFSRDKTPLITPRETSAIWTKAPPKTTQSKLSSSLFKPKPREPLRPKPSNKQGRGGLEFGDPDDDEEEEEEDDRRDTPKPSTSSAARNLKTLSNSTSGSASTSTSSSSRWKGKLSSRPAPHQPLDSTSSAPSIARRILNPSTSQRLRGPTIEFDRSDDSAEDDDDEMLGETQRRRRKRWDLGEKDGKLDLVDMEEAGVDVTGEFDRKSGSRSRGMEEDGEPSFARRKESVNAQSTARSKAHQRQLPTQHSTTSSSTSSAEDVQARLVPAFNRSKTQSRILVPDSDEPSPIEEEEAEGMDQEPDTELDEEDEEEAVERSRTPRSVFKDERTDGDDSGFVEVLDLRSSSPPPPQEEEEDDDASIPDSQPSVASHLSHPLGSSPPHRRSRSSSATSVMIIEKPSPSTTRRPLLQPTESAILMPPPPLDPDAPPRKRLRRGPPPRNNHNSNNASSAPSTSRVLVEDTQYSLSLPLSPRQNSSTSARPFPIVCDETQYDDAEEELRRWNQLHVRLPSDLPSLDSDQIVLPSPRPLRPLKTLSLPTTTPVLQAQAQAQAQEPVGDVDVGIEREEVGEGTVSKEWENLKEAWKGSKPLTPPPPPLPRQSRLTEHFSLNNNNNDDAEGEGEEVVIEDSQLEMFALERAVRESIHGLGAPMKRVEEERTEEKKEIEMEENEDKEGSICSSPLTELSPSPLPPSSPPPQHHRQSSDAQEAEAEEEEEEEEDRDRDLVLPDSDDEDERMISPLAETEKGGGGGSLLSSSRKFPSYELPNSVLNFSSNEEKEEEKRPEEEEEKNIEPEQSMWESYWTLPSQQAEHEHEEEEEEEHEEERTKTVTELLLEQAPEIDLPQPWIPMMEEGESMM